MDRETRSRIHRATQSARELLEHEYAEQLEGVFDIRLDGTVAAAPGEHLDTAQRVLRTKLVTAVEHQRAGGMAKPDAVATYLREAAFTMLNRFVALKMLEARELVQECITRGDQSAGFKEFTGLAPGLVQLPDHGYRIYIESVFDEIGREVRVLFDRRDTASLLWPRRQALLDLLAVLNAAELSAVWIEDETVGWVYQYFNGEDERRTMREASQAPRNSRELAVRNQFFTPRYVVQFLVDNTLGRIWYEMMRGDTGLRDLDYIVGTRHEVFLAEGDPVLEEPAGVRSGESSDRPSPIPFRAKKDPRDLKILDPACGSGHFLLYTFDLLLTLYEEAWQDESAVASNLTRRCLRDDYPELKALRTAAPELILRHNLHGIDIDPRCAQIAAFVLWMRAQRAFQEVGLARENRPLIGKTNIVVAEAMPGEVALRQAFSEKLEPRLAKLLQHVFDRMTLAGEAGYLLRIAEQTKQSIRQIYGNVGGLFEEAEKSEWARAAEDLRTALETFATQAAGTQSFARQLFAGDAARGLGFVDVCSQRYDTILMNPPFGDSPKGVEPISASLSPGKTRNLYAAFVARALELLSPGGALGVISSRTFITYTEFAGFRDALLDSSSLRCLADLGWEVLDGAQVETAAYVLSRNAKRSSQVGPFIRLLDVRHDDKHEALRRLAKTSESEDSRVFYKSQQDFRALPGTPLCYWATPSFVRFTEEASRLYPDFAYVGLGASPHAFYFRAWWEVPEGDIGNSWARISRGGDFSPYYRANRLVIRWAQQGAEVKAHILHKYPYLNGNYGWKIQDEDKYFAPSLTWGKRNERFNVQAMPEGHIFTDEGQGIIPHNTDDCYLLLGILNSALVAYYLSLTSGLQKHYVYVRNVPIVRCEGTARAELETAVRKYMIVKTTWARMSEVDPMYSGPLPRIHELRGRTLLQLTTEMIDSWHSDQQELASQRRLIDEIVFGVARIEPSDAREALDYRSQYPEDIPDDGTFVPKQPEAAHQIAMSLLSFALGHAFGRWNLRALEESESSQVNVFAWPSSRTSGCGASSADASNMPDRRCAGAAGGYWVLLDDYGHALDVVPAIEAAFENICEQAAENRLQEVIGALKSSDLRVWLRTRFFQEHISLYSATRRKAPIYWQLATPSTSYSAWLYYHRFSRDTLFRLLNDHSVPKLRREERKLTRLTQDAGTHPTSSERKEIETQEHFAAELRSFRDEVARVAPLWNPDLNDGAIINFAPLWRLVPHLRAWQKECRATWDRLCKGDYDWAHLAMHLWPERVVPKCAEDRSLSIAHSVEDVFWYEDSEGKWRPRKVEQDEIDKLVEERTSAAVKDSLTSLLQASAPISPRTNALAEGTVKRATSALPKAAANSGSSRSRSSSSETDAELLSKVRDAIAASGDGASKSDVIHSTGIAASEWNKAIKTLLADGSVTQTGKRRGSRYNLGGGDA